MTQPEDRYRRWLDVQSPSDAEARADLDATLTALQPRGGSGWRIAALVAVTAVILAVLVDRRTPAPLPPVAWGTRFDLHVAGRSPDTDVHIRIAVRQETP